MLCVSSLSLFEIFPIKCFALQRPQNLAVHLTFVAALKHDSDAKTEAYVGWTGMASASSLAHFNSSDSGERGLETIEIDPQYAQGLGLALGDVVRCMAYDLSDS
jgi:hypothetical protein